MTMLTPAQTRDVVGVGSVVDPRHEGLMKRPTEKATERVIERGVSQKKGEGATTMNNPTFLNQGKASQGEKKA